MRLNLLESFICKVPPVDRVILKFSVVIMSIEPVDDSTFSQNSIVKLLFSLNFSIRFELNEALIPVGTLTAKEG